MKISKVEVIPVSIPKKHAGVMKGIAMSAYKESVVLKLHTDKGVVGIAECGDTSTWYEGETQNSIVTLISKFFAPFLLGEDPTNIEKLVGLMDTIARGNSQAKATVDFALHDLTGKILNVPVYTLLGGKTIDRIKLGFVMMGTDPEKSAEEAKAIVDAGFHFVKFKSTTNWEEDCVILEAIRRKIGDKVDLFVDVNGAWTYDYALTAIRAMEKYNLSKIEQPLPEWDIKGMARLRGKVNMPVYADESARELHDMMHIINEDAADGLMIKIQKAGGLLKSQRWLTIARLANMPVICGCMGSSGLEASPAAHLLVANEWISRFPQENAGPLHLHHVLQSKDIKPNTDLALNVPRYENGFLYPNEKPGLGIDLNEDLLKKYQTPGKDIVVVSANK